jgi:hypothetical protein
MLAFEILDNFAHDKIYYERDGTVKQVMVHTHDDLGYSLGILKYEERLYPLTDPMITRYLNLRDNLEWFRSPALKWNVKCFIEDIFPSLNYVNQSRMEFVPTMQLHFFDVLNHYFQNHHLIATDFNFLSPESAIPMGYNSPIVQTRFQDKTIPCDTYLLKRGLFDIFFPTDFEVMQGVYDQIKRRKLKTSVLTHENFLRKYSASEKTRTQSGYNPMIEDFENVRFFLT